MSSNISVSITGGNHKGDRVANDFYASTPECVYSLMAVEGAHLAAHKVLEPCCGTGAISSILIRDYGLEVYSSDLIDRGYGVTGQDFLTMWETDCTAVVTNPPFNLAEKFIQHSLGFLKVEYLALLLKSQYWHSKKRTALFERYPPAVVYPMTWRPDFLNKGSPTMDCQWTVWRAGDTDTRYRPMHKHTSPLAAPSTGAAPPAP